MTAGLIKVAGCVSTAGYVSSFAPAKKWGIFKYPIVAERLVIATKRAWNAVNDPKNEGFLAALERDIKSGNVETERLTHLGLCPKFYKTKEDTWITFGLRMKEPNAREYAEYDSAHQLVHDVRKGMGRRAYLGIQGISATGVEDLELEAYRVLLSRMVDAYSGKHIGKIRSLRIESVPFNVLIKEEDGRYVQLVSRTLLNTMAKFPENFE